MDNLFADKDVKSMAMGQTSQQWEKLIWLLDLDADKEVKSMATGQRSQQ